MVEHVIDRLAESDRPSSLLYGDVIQRCKATELQTRVGEREGALWLKGPTKTYTLVSSLDRVVHYFGPHVAFDAEAWRNGED